MTPPQTPIFVDFHKHMDVKYISLVDAYFNVPALSKLIQSWFVNYTTIIWLTFQFSVVFIK